MEENICAQQAKLELGKNLAEYMMRKETSHGHGHKKEDAHNIMQNTGF